MHVFSIRIRIPVLSGGFRSLSFPLSSVLVWFSMLLGGPSRLLIFPFVCVSLGFPFGAESFILPVAVTAISLRYRVLVSAAERVPLSCGGWLRLPMFGSAPFIAFFPCPLFPGSQGCFPFPVVFHSDSRVPVAWVPSPRSIRALSSLVEVSAACFHSHL